MNVTELIERLRYGVEHYDDRDDAIMTRAADALEAQAREIRRLEDDKAVLMLTVDGLQSRLSVNQLDESK